VGGANWGNVAEGERKKNRLDETLSPNRINVNHDVGKVEVHAGHKEVVREWKVKYFNEGVGLGRQNKRGRSGVKVHNQNEGPKGPGHPTQQMVVAEMARRSTWLR